MRILGIESSCDETSAAVVSGPSTRPTLESLVILSQDVHTVFGGVVPEIASREHLTAIVPVTERALKDAGCALADIDAIAVTHAPGLVGALLVGVSYAKALAAATGKPLIGVHHMEGHLFATALEHPDATPPFTALLVSGGHTLLLDVASWGEYRLLGRTRDDAAGEAFDKAAKLLGLPYPGGRHLEALARAGDPKRQRFTKPMLNAGQKLGDADYYDVSFSGLKTAVLLATQQAENLEEEKPHIARGFQDALIGTLVAKTLRAAKAYGRKRIVLGGGVACNQALVDYVKLGFGTSMISRNVKEKVKLYRDAGLKVFVGGTLFEAFVVRGQFNDYVKYITDLGCDSAEVSDGSITIAHEKKMEYINTLSKNYTVFSEVGSKEEGIIIHPQRWISMMQSELEAGATKVIAEARESGTVGIFHKDGSAHTMLINRIVHKVKLENIIWETPQKSQQVYFLKMFGSNVNLGNIGVEEVIPLETLRIGLRGDTFFSFLPATMNHPI